MRRSFCYRVLPVLVLSFVAQAKPSVDFLVLGSPQIYTIFNQFEQPLSMSEKEKFLPFSPLEIIKSEDKLGDQITRAMRCAYMGNTCFLIKDDRGNLIGESAKEYRQIFRGCLVVDDTIEIQKEGGVTMYERYPSVGEKTVVKKGESIIRLFQYKGSYYVLRQGRKARFGWCPALPPESWRVKGDMPVIESKELTPELRDRLLARVEEANRAYRTYFEHFNQAIGKDKSIPSWRFYAEGQKLSWRMGGPYGSTDQLKESTQYLVRDMEGILVGKPFMVLYENGEIIVKAKK